MSNHKRRPDQSPLDPDSPTAIRLASKRQRRFQGPPQDERWFWMTEELLASKHLRDMSRAARLVLDRIILEHIDHRGTENGRLTVTYSDFARHGVRRQSVKPAIESLEAAGLIKFDQGSFASPERRRPNAFTLTWLSVDGYEATKNWKRVEVQYLRERLRLIRKKHRRSRNLRERHADR